VSFRLRVLVLVALVAVTATAATAWLVLRQASRQITETATATQADITTITTELTRYGWDHGTWEGVTDLVVDLRARTGLRIRLVADGGEVVADTDHFDGRAAREAPSPPYFVDPRPTLDLDEVVDPHGVTLEEIRVYREGVLLAACLTRNGRAPVAVADGPHGVPRYAPSPLVDPDTARECYEWIATFEAEQEADVAVVSRCRPVILWGPLVTPTSDPTTEPSPDASVDLRVEPTAEPEVRACLQQAFTQRTSPFAAVPLRVYVGAVDEVSSPVTIGPVLVVAGTVALLAVAGSLLISRRVLRPIEALTTASRRLGAGDLSERVPVVGRDELAELARSFNWMADSLQRGEERQRRLVADVAHELRTPLANLRGYLEALKDGVVEPDPELFASLHEEAVLQQRIVDDLQDLALAEAGVLVYHWSTVDLGELLETCRVAHQAVAEAGGVELTAGSDEPVYVRADPDRLRQVLGNLITNALRATAAGGSVRLRAVRDGRLARVTVADTGVGIAPSHLPHVFDRFWRADPARGRRTGGSGLGLAIARQIVTDHGGTITVASEVGVGTTFTVTLPAWPEKPGAADGGAAS